MRAVQFFSLRFLHKKLRAPHMGKVLKFCLISMNNLEITTFEENIGCKEKGHIHRPDCYVMFQERGAGLAKINRALAPYHHSGRKWGDLADSSVGDPHEICIIREKLQSLRFELL